MVIPLCIAVLTPVMVHAQTNAKDSPLRLCEKITLTRNVEPPFNDTEMQLLCGATSNSDLEAWKTIPRSQAELHLKNFLQARGYHTPRIEKSNNGLTIEPGTVTHVSKITAPAPLQIERKREILGKKLTPELLNELELWSKARLLALGFGCSRASARADPSSGSVELDVENLDWDRPQRVRAILADPSTGLLPGTLGRYYAFGLGETLNGDLLRITEDRITHQHILQNFRLVVDHCNTDHEAKNGKYSESDTVTLRQEALAGPARLMAFGVGANTEGLVLLKASWKNTRIGNRASQLEFNVFASSKEQSLFSSAQFYSLQFASRRHLRPELELKHQNEDPFELLRAQAHLFLATSLDATPVSLRFRSGPSFDLTRTLRGEGPRLSRFTSLTTGLELATHSFEFFKSNPRTGISATLDASLNHKDALSDATAQRLSLSAHALYNFNEYDPPLWILGFRGKVSTTLSDFRPGPGSALPPSYLHYLGGSSDIRGFGRKQLPLGDANPFGAATSFYLGTELRTHALLISGVEPLMFLDAGILSDSPLSVDPPLFWSPGIGARWASPIGTLRGTAARGFVAGQPESSQFQFYVSLGEEF